jgi:uncharacterized protein
MSLTSNGSAATLNASRYLQQLCKHWAHKFAVEFDAEKGRIDFGGGYVVTLKAMPDALAMTIIGDDVAGIEGRQKVVAVHIDRFAFREAPLNYRWDPPV